MNGYLLINLHIVGYLLYMRYLGRHPNPTWYVPFVFLSIVWAISIHTVTAFLYCGLGGRPFWNTALLAPRFLASAFVSGPAFIILVMRILRITTGYTAPPRSSQNIDSDHSRCDGDQPGDAGQRNLYVVLYRRCARHVGSVPVFRQLHGHTGLVPWIWTAIAFNIIGAILFFMPAALERGSLRIVACLLCIVGIWIEKGMGLIIPGFIPSTLHEIVEYSPSIVEWKVTAGIWAIGLLILTIMLKLISTVFTGQLDWASVLPE